MRLLVIVVCISLSTAHQYDHFKSLTNERPQHKECADFEEYLKNAGQQTIHVPPIKIRGMLGLGSGLRASLVIMIKDKAV